MNNKPQTINTKPWTLIYQAGITGNISVEVEEKVDEVKVDEVKVLKKKVKGWMEEMADRMEKLELKVQELEEEEEEEQEAEEEEKEDSKTNSI